MSVAEKLGEDATIYIKKYNLDSNLREFLFNSGTLKAKIKIVNGSVAEDALNVNSENSNEQFSFSKGDESQYSIARTRNMSWEEQIDGYISGDGTIKSSDSLYLGESDVPNVQNSPLYIPTSIINKAMREPKGSRSAHSLTEDDIRELNKDVKNAPIVIHNPARNALVYITENKKTPEGYVIATFDLNNNLYGETAHKATSIHRRENIKTMVYHLDKDATVYVKNKNKFNQMLPGIGIQSSKLLANVELAEDNIAQTLKTVNSENSNEQFSFSKTETEENSLGPMRNVLTTN